MKNRKLRKILLTICSAMLLVCLSVGATVAYLTDTKTVTNTFVVGKVAITLDEAAIKQEENGANWIADSTQNRVKSNKYHLLPGISYAKDPTVHVDKNSEDCYLFVKVVNDITAIEDSSNTIASQMAAKGWKAVEGKTGIYVYVGTAEGATDPLAVAKSTDVTVFEKIVVATTVDNKTLANYANKTVVVTAYAVQKDGFEGKSAAEIWAAAFATN